MSYKYNIFKSYYHDDQILIFINVAYCYKNRQNQKIAKLTYRSICINYLFIYLFIYFFIYLFDKLRDLVKKCSKRFIFKHQLSSIYNES